MPKGFVEIDVKNSGESLSRDEVSRFNQPGFQFDMTKLQSGQGNTLGLHMSQGIAEQHGGYVKVSSKGVGHTGSCFSLVLPLFDVPESDIPECLKPRKQLEVHGKNSDSAGSEEKANDDTAGSRRNIRILVVDDSKVCRRMLVRLLQTKGYKDCSEAENGLSGTELVKRAMEEGNEYDVILVDNEMPVMKGPEAVREMRRSGCKAFISGVTGNLLPDDIDEFKRGGVDCVFPKPLNLTDLESRWTDHGIRGRKTESRESY